MPSYVPTFFVGMYATLAATTQPRPLPPATGAAENRTSNSTKPIHQVPSQARVSQERLHRDKKRHDVGATHGAADYFSKTCTWAVAAFASSMK